MIKRLPICVIYLFALIAMPIDVYSAPGRISWGRPSNVQGPECWVHLAPGAQVWGVYQCDNCGSTTSSEHEKGVEPVCSNCGKEHTTERWQPPIHKNIDGQTYVLNAIFKNPPQSKVSTTKSRKGKRAAQRTKAEPKQDKNVQVYQETCPTCNSNPLQVIINNRQNANPTYSCTSCDTELPTLLRIAITKTAKSHREEKPVVIDETADDQEIHVIGAEEDGNVAPTLKGEPEVELVDENATPDSVIFGRNAPAQKWYEWKNLRRFMLNEMNSFRGRVFAALMSTSVAASSAYYGYQPVIYEGLVTTVTENQITISYGKDLNKTLVLTNANGDLQANEGDHAWVHARKWIGPKFNGVELESGDFAAPSK